MKLLSHLSIIRGIGYLFVFTLCVNCKKDFNSTNPSQLPPEVILESGGDNLAALAVSSQTKTASRFNDFQGVYVDSYIQGGAGYVAYDDNSYAYTRKLSRGNSYASLVLQGFGFTIPDGAIIENIIVSARRFKKGKASITDHFATLVINPPVGQGFFSPYGVFWRNTIPYPATETEVIYSQSGTGNNGGPGDQFYQWTPTMINDLDFGVRIDVYTPVGAGSVVVYYDLVEITVEYSSP